MCRSIRRAPATGISAKPPDPRAQAATARHGVDISGLKARQVTVQDFARFDLIFALDRDNQAELEAMTPADAKARVRLLMDCVSGREGEAVADPYFGDEEGFGITWADVSAAARAIADRLRR